MKQKKKNLTNNINNNKQKVRKHHSDSDLNTKEQR